MHLLFWSPLEGNIPSDAWRCCRDNYLAYTEKNAHSVAPWKQRGLSHVSKEAKMAHNLADSDAKEVSEIPFSAGHSFTNTNDDDDFGLSSGDEAELLSFEVGTAFTIKRELEDEDENHAKNHSKKIKQEDQDQDAGDVKEIVIKPDVKDEPDHSTTPRIKLEDSTAIEIANDVLVNRFNIPSFRLKQQDAISRILNSDSAVVVFPTGGGKSLCY